MNAVSIISWIVIILMTVTIHEVMHGYIAYWRGDPTAQEQGRLTLNPLKHIDLFWTILFPAFLLLATGGRFALGMAKPVPVNYLRLKRPRLDMIWVALAGPVANLVLAWILATWFHTTRFIPFLYGVYLNLGLGFFNLIPIPPLDGSRVVSGLLPLDLSRVYNRLEPFGFWIVLLLYMSGMLFALIMPGVNAFARILDVPPIYV